MRKTIRTMWLTVTALMCMSCGPSLDDRVADLVEAKDVWLSVAGDRPYSYTLKFGQRSPYTVSVSDPGTLREDWLENRECSEFGDCRVTPTMRELFEFVLDLIDDQFQSGGELIVEYDDLKDFPKRIFFDDRRGSHSAFTVEVSDVVFTQD